jgi:hypothetical protein
MNRYEGRYKTIHPGFETNEQRMRRSITSAHPVNCPMQMAANNMRQHLSRIWSWLPLHNNSPCAEVVVTEPTTRIDNRNSSPGSRGASVGVQTAARNRNITYTSHTAQRPNSI